MMNERPGQETGGGPGRGPADFMRQLVLALDLPVFLIGAIMGGGFAGYLLDRWLHTAPWLTLVLGLVGFIAGLRGVLVAISRRGGPR
jgi:F0F1-type ATP synthase assembly protein I